MVLNVTHSYVIMKVSAPAYFEIRKKLVDAGYQHALHEDREDGTLLDMHGIALAIENPVIDDIVIRCPHCDAVLKGRDDAPTH